MIYLPTAPVARPRQISDEDILAEVRRAVGEAGPGFSMDLVAERLGVTPPALFKRFGSRKALMIAALGPPRPPFLDALEGGPDERPIAIQLAAHFELIGAWLSEHMPRMMALCESGIPLREVHAAFGDPPPVVIIRAMTRWLARATTRGLVRIADPESCAMAMVGALQQRTLLAHFLRRTVAAERDLRRDARRITELFLDGIAITSRSKASAKRARA